jgi:hypothetical protein
VERTEGRIDPAGLERHFGEQDGDCQRRGSIDQPSTLLGGRGS